MKHILILIALSLLAYNVNAQDNDSLIEDNKAYIESLKKRIDKVEQEIDPSYLIAKLRDSINLLENKIAGLENKLSTTKKIVTEEVVVFFGFNKTTLTNDEKSKISQTLSSAKKIKQVVINAYTDSTGSQNINNFISQQRASTVKDYLIKQYAISDEKIFISWHGSNNSEGERKAVISVLYE